MDAETRAKRRASFAPYAEALKLTTDCVVSAQTDDSGRSFTVLYTETPTRSPDAMLYRAVLWTNLEDILEVVETRPLCTLGRFAAQVKLIMGGAMAPMPDPDPENFRGLGDDITFQ